MTLNTVTQAESLRCDTHKSLESRTVVPNGVLKCVTKQQNDVNARMHSNSRSFFALKHTT